MKTPTNNHAESGDQITRCVLLFHQVDDMDHWDLMLEFQNKLWTWRLEQLPTANQTVLGKRIIDHRIHYLDYEGPVSHNRGTVKRIRSGHYHWGHKSETRLAFLQFEQERWNVLLEDDNQLAKISIVT